ncbi:hypothetical protein PIB30_066218 [Stylosanthes scabra]|uniref:Uncharacterized protein n=1 Tax=Stylosanthes scabra TaxID=79078 RepID=A0ABU6QM47_9FABA|nr:hypothetical protein [Stylosanthes scabra]
MTDPSQIFAACKRWNLNPRHSLKQINELTTRPTQQYHHHHHHNNNTTTGKKRRRRRTCGKDTSRKREMETARRSGRVSDPFTGGSSNACLEEIGFEDNLFSTYIDVEKLSGRGVVSNGSVHVENPDPHLHLLRRTLDLKNQAAREQEEEEEARQQYERGGRIRRRGKGGGGGASEHSEEEEESPDSRSEKSSNGGARRRRGRGDTNGKEEEEEEVVAAAQVKVARKKKNRRTQYLRNQATG